MKHFTKFLFITLLVLLIGNISSRAQVVSSAIPTEGNSYVVAAYVNDKYYALPNTTTNGGTLAGVEITLNSANKVNTSDASNKTWTLEEGTTSGQFYFKYTSNNSIYYLYKNGTGKSNYNFKVSTGDKNYWTFTEITGGYTVTAVDRGSNHLNIQCNGGTFRCYSTATPIILLEIGDATSYTITPQSNNTDYGTVSLSGTTITATPEDGYRVSITNPYTVTSGTATVTQNGNTFSVSASSNCTVQINFEAIPVATATSSNTSYGTVSFDGTTITAEPATGYRVSTTTPYTVTPSGAATITDNGDNTFTVTDITEDCTVQINFEAIPTHNLDIYINGQQVSGYPQTLAEGEHFDFPTAPATIESGEDTYNFVGWVANTPITEPTDTRPETVYTTTGATMGQNNVTLYALYATGSSTMKWKRTTVSAVSESGTYALIDANGYAFNGTISSGHGQTTSTAFSFDSDGYATSAPSNTLELTLTTVTNGFTLYGGSEKGYLYASKSSSGGLAFHNTESSYWKNNNNELVYNSNSAYLRYYNGTNNTRTFRTYSSTSNGTGACQFAQKVTVNTYANYCTTIGGTVKAEANLSFENSEDLAVLDESYTLQALTNPNNLSPISYTSGDTNVATISGTTVTLVATGTTVITASFEGNDDYKAGTATYTLQVVAKPAAPVFTPATGATVKVGDKIKVEPGNGAGTADKLYYSINSGEEQNRNTNSYNEITVTEDMIGTLTIAAYHTLTLGETTLTGASATATYTVVNPVATINEPATLFANTFDVTLTASPANATLYYTTDGTDPTTSSTQYTGTAITLSATTTIKAIAVITIGEENFASSVVSQTYKKNTAVVSTEGEDYYLVTDASTLADGDKIVIVNGDELRIMDDENGYSDSNRKTSSFTFNQDNSITPPSQAEIITLGDEGNGLWKLYTKQSTTATPHYLYASSGSNWLKIYDTGTEPELSKATISIDASYNAKIVFYTDTDGDHYIMLNNNNSLFSCYHGTQKEVQIYRNAQIDAITLYENRTGIDASNLYDGTVITNNANNTVTVNLYRSLVAGCWNAICLPFDLDNTKRQLLFGEGYDLQAFTSVTSDATGTHLNFTKVPAETTMTAGTPYIVYPTQTVQAGAVVPLSNVTISATTAGTVEQTLNGATYAYHGFFAPTALIPGGSAGSEDKSTIYIGTGNKFVYAKGTTKNPTAMLKGYRGYFTLPEGVELSKVSMELNCDDDLTTGISSMHNEEGIMHNSPSGVYDLQGRKIADNPSSFFSHPSSKKGLYIVNGKKIVIR